MNLYKKLEVRIPAFLMEDIVRKKQNRQSESLAKIVFFIN